MISSFLKVLKNIPNYIYHILLVPLLVTFIIFIIQYMDDVKNSFLDMNILIGIYIVILIIPFYNIIKQTIFGPKRLKYFNEFLMFLLFLIVTITHSVLNAIFTIKGDSISNAFHILFIIISILFFCNNCIMTLELGTKITDFLNKQVVWKFTVKHVFLSIIFTLVLANYTIVLGQVIYKQNNRTVDL